MIKVSNKEYRNLPQQVAKNADDIEKLQKYTDLYTTYVAVIAGTTSDADSHEDIIWQITAYCKAKKGTYTSYSEWIQDAIDAGTFSLDNILIYDSGDLRAVKDISYQAGTNDGEIDISVTEISTAQGGTVTIDISDYSYDTEFEV